jgi:hypothetical protein
MVVIKNKVRIAMVIPSFKNYVHLTAFISRTHHHRARTIIALAPVHGAHDDSLPVASAVSP